MNAQNRKISRFIALGAVSSFALMLASCVSDDTAKTTDTAPAQLEMSGFDDAVQHWRSAHGRGYARYEPEQIDKIADNILLLQRKHGGWVQNRDPQRILNDEDIAKLMAEKTEAYGSIDNRNVYTQIAYLMGAYEKLGDERYRDGALRGLDYLLEHQIKSCGGWPHSVPASQSYHGHITVADEVFSGPLRLLRDISGKRWPYESLDNTTHSRATKALQDGETCLLNLQVIQDGKPTAWAGQYDPETLEPAMGRTFELPSIATQESVYILRYLMSIEDPSPEIIASVEGGVSWLKQVAIKDTRLERFELPEPVKFRFHTTSHDRRLVDDPDAPLLWARFYDVNDNSIVLANRDSVRVYDYQDVSMERRTGYNWFDTWGNSLLEEDYPAWKKRVY